MQPTKKLPGQTTEIHAKRALVLAPHADDDILGCGGLLTQLAAAGSDVRVLFLTDSSGGTEVTDNTELYAERRRREATDALEILGITDVEFLDLPDGELDQYAGLATGAIEKELLEYRPDLLLAVSPLEVTRDHQAAFRALHQTLSQLRGDGELDQAVEDLRILLYEINHPGYPDVLVDVSAEIQDITEAIKKHASQLELHNYLKAAIGIRRYRTLSLPTSVTAAEGYRELRVADFVTHGVAGMIRALGGCPTVHEVKDGPSISVVVRTKDRPELLAEALASLAAGSYRNSQVVLVNDGGVEPSVPDDYPFEVVRVNLPENVGRAAAANAGVEAATGDYVAFLDDDDLAEPEHLATLAGLVAAEDVRIAYTDAAVGIYVMDPELGWRQVERRLPYSRDFDPELLFFDNYIPFNTLLIDRKLFAEVGPFDAELPFFEDWDMLIRLAQVTDFHHLGQVTCEYRHFRGGGRHVFGERPADERSDFFITKGHIIERYRELQTPELIATVIGRLRAEAVAKAEESAAVRTELSALRDAYSRLETGYHALNGEAVGLRNEVASLTEERDRLTAELDRRPENDQITLELYQQRDELRATLDQRDDELRHTFAEIDRLNQLIGEMEGTKAWRLHRTIERFRGKAD
jgi:LmbE family N-acetylglucosaminyl deacetylase/glycosyltransferase involved in cell wall biosynthesis